VRQEGRAFVLDELVRVAGGWQGSGGSLELDDPTLEELGIAVLASVSTEKP
jgi:hypothetical protein